MDSEYSQHTESRCSIQDLSSELVFMIMDHLPFPTQFDLARTCKRLAVASRGVLERHQDSFEKYRAASDLDPSTVPLLLRGAFGYGDPIPAWHVRSFEVWKDRTTWSEWQTFDLHTPLIAGPDRKPPQFRVSREEARRYLYWFEEQLGEDLEFELVEKLLAQVESGHDGLLKALLFAKLSCLEDLKFVTRSQEAGSCLASLRVLIAECIKKEGSRDSSDSDDEDNEEPCGCENCSDGNNDSENVRQQDNESNGDCQLNVIEQRSTNTTVPWPTGFCNIRKVAVGVASGTWMDDNREEEPCSFLFSHLLRLPLLNSIYFNKLCAYMDGWDMEMDPEEEECDYEVLPKGSSSVKHIFLHGSSGIFGEEEDDLWAAPRELLTMSFRFDGSEEFDGSTGTANALARLQKESLQSLMWYGYTDGSPRNIVGNHCTILDDEEFDHFKRLPAMRHMSVCMNDIELCIEHADTYQCLRSDPHEGRDDDDDQGNIYDEDNHDEFIVRRVATMFPRTMETLVLWDHPGEDMAGRIERGLIKMIQSGRYKKLKAIFLEATERASEGSRKEKLWYRAAVVAGKKAGVDVYTLSNQEGMQHSIEFAEAPDEYDLQSGIHAGSRPSNWVFDPYLGRRIPLGCKAEWYGALWTRLESSRKAYWGELDT